VKFVSIPSPITFLGIKRLVGWWKSLLQVSEVFEVNRTECDPCSVSQEGCWYHPAPWPKGSSLHALGLAAEEMRFHMPAEVTQIFQSGRPPSFSPAVFNQLAFSWPIFSHSRCFSLYKHRSCNLAASSTSPNTNSSTKM